MSYCSCRACGSAKLTLRYKIQGYEILYCLRCSSMTTACNMEVTDAKDFYAFEYFHGGDYENYPSTEYTSKRNFSRFVHRMLPYQPSGRLLEIGCAYGYFLDIAEKYWRVSGIDISWDAIKACRDRFGNSVHFGDLLAVDLPDSHYDWIVGWDTIEHLDRPRAYVERCFTLQRSGGYLALTTGDISALFARIAGQRWRLLTPPSHLTFFSKQGMQTMLQSLGYEIVTIGTIGYDRNLDFTLYRLLGKQRYEKVVNKSTTFQRFLQQRSFYIDLGDIMFVLAKKPA